MDSFMEQIVTWLYIIPIILISLTVHEVSHGYISYLMGDPTAKSQGRLTLNPLKHLDPIGTLMFFIVKIGWAKPVPINPGYYKNKKKGIVLTSIAGPISNLIIAFIAAIPMIILFYTTENIYSLPTNDISVIFFTFFNLLFIINVNLAIFNLLPIPPLDGSKILYSILPEKLYFGYMKYERYIGIGLIILVILSPGTISNVLETVTGPVKDFIIGIIEPIVRNIFI